MWKYLIRLLVVAVTILFSTVFGFYLKSAKHQIRQLVVTMTTLFSTVFSNYVRSVEISETTFIRESDDFYLQQLLAIISEETKKTFSRDCDKFIFFIWKVFIYLKSVKISDTTFSHDNDKSIFNSFWQLFQKCENVTSEV